MLILSSAPVSVDPLLFLCYFVELRINTWWAHQDFFFLKQTAQILCFLVNRLRFLADRENLYIDSIIDDVFLLK